MADSMVATGPLLDYACHDRLKFAIKCQALLQVVEGRRQSDGFTFPGEPFFDSSLFPSHLLSDAFQFIGGIFYIYDFF